ncbi:MAG: MarR family transcriptional regulator [Anaerolineales bacterium]|nr:MarR family transcriptional regulator [Anaerolineales bacterium]
MSPLDSQKPYRLIHDVYVLMDYGDTLVFNDFDITTSQMSVLRQLDTKIGVRFTELSKRILRSKSAVTRLIDQLEAKQYVQRVDDPHDRRAQGVLLTATGAKVRAEINKKHNESLAWRFSTLGDDEQLQLAELMDKLRAGLVDLLDLE